MHDRDSLPTDRAWRRCDFRLLVLVWLLGVLGGCGSSSGGGPSKSQIAAATAARPAAPGASLAVAQAAIVTYLPAGSAVSSHKLRVVVQSISQGPVSDLTGLQLDADQKDAAPDYVRVEITNLGPGGLSDGNNNAGLPDTLMGVDDAGNLQEALTFIVGNFTPCDEKDVPDPLKSGQTYSTCLTFVVRHGITKLAYTGTQAYVESPVTWKASK